jgi:hypothetical protein
MAIHTCPRCELRFERESELADHLVSDHRLDPDAVRAHPVPTRERAGRQRVIVVGNHTLLSERLRERLQQVAGEGEVDIHVVVPVGHDDDLDVALWRGRALAERIVAPGVELTVDAGVGDPVDLVGKSLHHAHVDRVLVSTLPAGISRWLGADLPGRLRHATHAPVEVVTAEG